MPYKDPDKRRQAARDSKRRTRAGLPRGLTGGRQPVQPIVEPALRLRTVAEWLGLLETAANAVLVAKADPLATGRVISSLAAVGLRACEGADLEARIAALETRLDLWDGTQS